MAMVYSYVLFPLLLRALVALRLPEIKDAEPSERELPMVQIFMAVYNEEQVLAQKLESVFASHYPPEKIQILVGSDASSDQTDHILEQFQPAHPNLRWQRFSSRTGKPGIINQLVAAHGRQGAIYILTDANVFFHPDMLRHLAGSFRDPAVALAGANVQNLVERNREIAGQEKFYIQRENRIKQAEGALWGTMMGAFGGCYALRASSYRPVPSRFIADDFFLCMETIRQGGKAILQARALCFEDLPDSVAVEFRRKRRIGAGNYQNLWNYKKLLFLFFQPAGFCFWSHKVIRWLGPFLMLLSWAAAALLAHPLNPSGPWNIYTCYLLFQVILFLLVATDELLRRLGLQTGPLRLLTYFYKMNLALFAGFILWVRGIRSNQWTPTERQIKHTTP